MRLYAVCIRMLFCGAPTGRPTLLKVYLVSWFSLCYASFERRPAPNQHYAAHAITVRHRLLRILPPRCLPCPPRPHLLQPTHWAPCHVTATRGQCIACEHSPTRQEGTATHTRGCTTSSTSIGNSRFMIGRLGIRNIISFWYVRDGLWYKYTAHNRNHVTEVYLKESPLSILWVGSRARATIAMPARLISPILCSIWLWRWHKITRFDHERNACTIPQPRADDAAVHTLAFLGLQRFEGFHEQRCVLLLEGFTHVRCKANGTCETVHAHQLLTQSTRYEWRTLGFCFSLCLKYYEQRPSPIWSTWSEPPRSKCQAVGELVIGW